MTTESNSAVTVTEQPDSILHMTLDLPGKGANILSARMFDELEEAITPYLNRDDIQGLILLSGKPKIFVAGANLNEIEEGLDWPDEKIIAFCERGREVMSLFHTAPFTTVAAIHGACVGGGFELTLWCDYRIASDDRRTVIGLPEVNLGLIPGWGGTVRVARLAGIETQIDLVTSAKLLNGSEAAEAVLVDQVMPHENLVAVATELIQEATAEEVTRRRELSDAPLSDLDPEELTKQYTEKICHPDNPIYPVAPLIALEHILRAASLPLTEACDSESRAFAEAWGSPASYGLLHNFFLNDYAKKIPAGYLSNENPQDVNRVGVVGMGVMGKAIAALNLKMSKTVSIVEPDETILQATKATLESGIKNADDDRLNTHSSISDLPDQDLVIEAVPELPQLKRQVLADMERQVSGDTIIATNTSAIRISELANAVEHPERFCGIHFCHPQLMSLVEIIPTEATTRQALAAAVSYVRSLRKTSIVVKDSPGFAVNRLLSSLFHQSVQLVLAGHSFWRIDAAMREFGFRAGPFEIMDIIGIDTCVLAGRAMWDNGLRDIDNSPVLPRMMKLNRLGRKTGLGFYKYETDSSPAETDEEAVEIVAAYQSDLAESEQPRNNEGLVNAILKRMAEEAHTMLDNDVVEDPRALDLATIHGFGFPAHEGGIMFWASRNLK